MRQDPRSGFTLIEAIISLVIIASACIPILNALSGAAATTMDTVSNRKLRHLAQLILSDIELGEIVPASHSEFEEVPERYEEGSSDDFSGWASDGRPGEYDDYRYVVEVLREEVVAGGEDQTALEESGFSQDEDGRIMGRAISNDFGSEGEEELMAPPGQVKRLLVLAIERIGEDASDDQSIRVMAYLPVPGEEERSLGGEGEGGEGGGLPGAPGAAGTSTSLGADGTRGTSSGDRK